MTTVSEGIQKINKLFPKGRLRRRNFIGFEILTLSILMLCLGVIMDQRMSDNTFIGLTVWTVILGLIVLQLYIVSKRLQDCGFMAIYSLLVFVPMLNGFLALLLCLYPGVKGENKYGQDPRMTFSDKEKEPESSI